MLSNGNPSLQYLKEQAESDFYRKEYLNITKSKRLPV